MTRSQVVQQVDTSFGEPLLTVATGSVMAGFGNSGSDLDVYSVVPETVSSTLPLTAYVNGALIEVVLHGADPVMTRHRELTADEWPPAEVGPGDLASRRLHLDSLSRFALGLALAGTPEWLAWKQQLGGEVVQWITSWYAVEAVRKQVSARTFAPRKPIVAALRMGEALWAALERHAALHGEWYFKPKWLGEKLRRLDDRAGLDAFRLASCPPLSPDGVPAYLEEVGALVDHYLTGVDSDQWRITVKPAYGTDRYAFGGTELFSRWGLRTVSVPADGPTSGRAEWTYGITDTWDDEIAGLFAEDVLWMGVEKS
ncbi:hypothetical protein [Nocardia ninae]|uniref:hypothetical protein n=1 Tax=Nocardia ninae TaxID=356145 RepID=UPI001C99F2E0|nr:hypothetical protein [Nocardia ninae]